jgi:hypothetical protein
MMTDPFVLALLIISLVLVMMFIPRIGLSLVGIIDDMRCEAKALEAEQKQHEGR